MKQALKQSAICAVVPLGSDRLRLAVSVEELDNADAADDDDGEDEEDTVPAQSTDRSSSRSPCDVMCGSADFHCGF